jgi:hypothetical protein
MGRDVAPADPTGLPLELCECERANGPPAGLGCDKEGFFISGFEQVGGGPGLVRL